MMTPQQRRDAQLELRDMALELEQGRSPAGADHAEMLRLHSERWNRAQLLRAVAAELERVPEEQ